MFVIPVSWGLSYTSSDGGACLLLVESSAEKQGFKCWHRSQSGCLSTLHTRFQVISCQNSQIFLFSNLSKWMLDLISANSMTSNIAPLSHQIVFHFPWTPYTVLCRVSKIRMVSDRFRVRFSFKWCKVQEIASWESAISMTFLSSEFCLFTSMLLCSEYVIEWLIS